ncbi:tetratricopeptide repeat protein [Prochlorococcus sp. MIT 1306]|uniref:tetratricopeptide repeat protein n=1 Tax=Prochlorococcus sp. MIT 1306 TaxID=1799667 RepID=UPI0007B34D5E|nr:tetratricopeptide repeat protein [Prochlorococcus sp. MIT 1306]KZR61432.1 TPR repeat-containing protein YrrB [Prochlorococcus sp. MIT 1306]
MNQQDIFHKLQAAVEAYQSREIDIAETLFNEILAIIPDEPNSLHLLGCINNDRGNLHQAVTLIEASIEADNSSYIPFLNLGRILNRLEQYKKAELVIKEALKRNQSLASAWFSLGVVMRNMGKSEEAIQYYRNTLALDPSNDEAACNLGALLIENNEEEEAMQVLSQALTINPHNFDCLMNYGLVLQSQGHTEDAIQCFKKIVQLKPDFKQAYISLGKIFRSKGDYLLAIDAYRNLLQFPLEDQYIYSHGSKSLVLDKVQTSATHDIWLTLLDQKLSGSKSMPKYHDVVKILNDDLYPPLFKDGKDFAEPANRLNVNGYQIEEDLIDRNTCNELISTFSISGKPLTLELIQAIVEAGIMRKVLELILAQTNFPHLIWNLDFTSKKSNDKTRSDIWHYDNHFNSWTPKLMIYLNSQKEERGATSFVKAAQSRQISKRTGYMGFLFQRDKFEQYVSPWANLFTLDNGTYDPPHYNFSPDTPGQAVLFYPSRTFHRGVPPIQGVRHVLTFSFTPLPADCDLTIDQCVDRSVQLLNNASTCDDVHDCNPFWISAN